VCSRTPFCSIYSNCDGVSAYLLPSSSSISYNSPVANFANNSFRGSAPISSSAMELSREERREAHRQRLIAGAAFLGLDIDRDKLDDYDERSDTDEEGEALFQEDEEDVIRHKLDKVAEVCASIAGLSVSAPRSGRNAHDTPRTDTPPAPVDDGYLNAPLLYNAMIRTAVTNQLKEQLANTHDLGHLYSTLMSYKLAKRTPFNEHEPPCRGLCLVTTTDHNESKHYVFSMDPCYHDNLKLVITERERIAEQERVLRIAQEDLQNRDIAVAANIDAIRSASVRNPRGPISDVAAATGSNSGSRAQTLSTADVMDLNPEGVPLMDAITKKDLPNYITDHVQCNVIVAKSTMCITDVYFTLRKTAY